MNELDKLFTNEEIEELEVFKDGTEAMSVEGREIVCFLLLHQLVNENIPISTIPKDKLLTMYAQLKGFKEISYSLGIFDTRLLESIVNKSKRFISMEIDKRK